jgi:hypothetical protein
MRRSDSNPSEAIVSVRDWNSASPDEIKAGIARTRAHMDERLTDLGRKIHPSAKLRKAKIPLAAGAAALCALLAYRAARAMMKSKSERHGPKAGINRLKLKSAGVFDYVRALRLLATTISKGKPGIFIVDPGTK